MGVKLQSSSGGSVEIAAPVTASNYVLTAPAANGTILNDASSLAAAMLTGNVDVARLVSAFSGSNVSLASNGYQKLPSGLIIQWGSGSASNTGYTNTFPIAFPSSCASIVGLHPGGPPMNQGGYVFCSPSVTPLTTFTAFNNGTVSPVSIRYIAIGY